jgi:putative oxidoreductase
MCRHRHAVEVTAGTPAVQRAVGNRDGGCMSTTIPLALLAPRVHGGRSAAALLALRAVSGVFLVGVGLGKFAGHASEVADFRHYGVPLPDIAVPLAGVVEVVGGTCVLVGLLTRPAAVAVALNLLVALLTAGITDGGTFHLVVGPSVLLAMVVLVVLGAPAPSVDAVLLSRRGPPHTPR